MLPRKSYTEKKKTFSPTGCTGKRDRAAFVPVSAMTEATLASDIGLLEEVERAAAAGNGDLVSFDAA